MLFIFLLSLVTPLLGQGVRFGGDDKLVGKKTGLLQTAYGINPLGHSSSSGNLQQNYRPNQNRPNQNFRPNQNQRPHQNQGNPCGYERCCCTRRRHCQSSPGIDLRIQTSPANKCRRNEIECCLIDPPKPPPNPHCRRGQQCCCTGTNVCRGTTDGSGLIDIRLKPSSSSQHRNRCGYNQIWCCAENIYPEPTYPPEPTYRPEPTYPPTKPPVNNGCGQRFPPSYGFKRGEQADFAEFPWIALLLTPDDYFLGTGALIDQYNIITADHKVFNYTARNIKIRLGDYDLANTDARVEPLPYIEVYPSRIIHHPNSNVRYSQKDPNLKYNIAVIQLKKPVHFQKHIQPVCLPSYNSNFANKNCWVAGWGKDHFDGSYQRILKKVQVPILRQDQCRIDLERAFEDLYREHGYYGPKFEYDDYSFICAGGITNNDACTGDGGAPLVCKEYDRYYVAGLVAWGLKCGKARVPGVYVNVKSFTKFIQDNSYNYAG